MGCKGSKSAGATPVVVQQGAAQGTSPAQIPTQASAQKKGELPPGTEVLFVLGGPGSGKGTQCERIVAKYGLKHLSAGDLLRDEVKSKSALGLELESIMKEGKLVPQETTIALLRKAMISSGCDKFLIDGFPRALDQAKTFEKTVCLPRMVLFFECPLETMEERLLSRGKTSGRSDDNVETIKKRFKTFQEQSMPVVEYYEEQGKVKQISAVPPPDEVFVKVEETLDGVKAQQAGEAVGAQQVAAMAAPSNPTAAQAIQAEVRTEAVGAMQVDPDTSTAPAARTRESSMQEAAATSTATTEAAPHAVQGAQEITHRPSFIGIDDPELAEKIEAASQVTILGTTAGRLEDSVAKPLQADADVPIDTSKFSSDGSRTVVEMPVDASSTAQSAAA